MDKMVVTTLEGLVLPQNHKNMIKTYREGVVKLPPEIVETFLVQDGENKNIWRIMTVWRSMSDLKEMRKKGTPTGVLIFRYAKAEPKLTINRVEVHAKGKAE